MNDSESRQPSEKEEGDCVGGNDDGGWVYFDLDGAYFRRPAKSASRAVTHVLHGRRWVPYQGRDPLKPGAFGDVIEDPLARSNDKNERP